MHRSRAAGFTLVEVMVALAIGLAVISALIAAYIASTRSGRRTDALVQITEDATLALSVMRQQVAQAGYGVLHGTGASDLALHAFPPVKGCSGAAFADLQQPITGPANCAQPPLVGTPSDTLEVAYESPVQAGGTSNAILGGAGGKQPLDCLGNSFAAVMDPTTGAYWLNDSKFYVDSGSLMCHGPGNAAGAAVVQNVEVLQVRYGMAAAAAGDMGGSQIIYYDAAPAPGSALWDDVLAVSLCVQVRSAAKVLDTATAPTLGGYVDCGNVARTSADGYMRRTFTTTIVLQNRLP